MFDAQCAVFAMHCAMFVRDCAMFAAGYAKSTSNWLKSAGPLDFADLFPPGIADLHLDAGVDSRVTVAERG
jgi:hypothetical protein